MSQFSKLRSSKTQSEPGSLPFQSQPVEFAYISLQRTQRGLVGMLLACAVLGMTVFKGPSGTLGNRTFLPVILSTTLLTFAYTIRNSMVLPSLAELRRNPRDAKVLKRWSRNNLIVQSLCAVVGLLGFAMQLMGAAMPIALTLYAIAVAYLFLLRPLKP
jgi:disulfide bond formation protein DsbB